jgi:hypothetical protein
LKEGTDPNVPKSKEVYKVTKTTYLNHNGERANSSVLAKLRGYLMFRPTPMPINKVCPNLSNVGTMADGIFSPGA